MNGRLYDAATGRFLSADPAIQYADDMQNYNRYSYINNNPLSAVDYSGYGWNPFKAVGKLFKKIAKAIKSILKNKIIRIAASIAAAWYFGIGPEGYGLFGAGGAAGSVSLTASAVTVGALNGAAAGFAGAFIASGWNLKAGLTGAVTGGITGGLFADPSAFGDTLLGRGFGGGVHGFLQTGKINGFARGFASGLIPNDLGFKDVYLNNATTNIAIGITRDGIRGAIVGGRNGIIKGIEFGQLNNAVGHILGAASSGFQKPTFKNGAFYYPDNNNLGSKFGYSAITFGNVINDSSKRFELYNNNGDSWLDTHERGHISQSNWMGASYLPLQAISQWTRNYIFERAPWHPLGYETERDQGGFQGN